MSVSKRRLHPGTLIASCLAVALTGCGGGGGGGEQPTEAAGSEPSPEPLVLAAALPTDTVEPTDPDAGNPFEVGDPSVTISPDVPASQTEAPAAPDGEPEDIVYCD